MVLGLVLLFGRGTIAGWFTDDDQVRSLVEAALVILAIIQPVGALVFVGDGLYLGAGAFRFLAAATLGASLVTAVLLALVPVNGWGVPGVWWAIAVLIGLRGLAFVARYGSRSAIG